jgi:hypothetical protein
MMKGIENLRMKAGSDTGLFFGNWECYVERAWAPERSNETSARAAETHRLSHPERVMLCGSEISARAAGFITTHMQILHFVQNSTLRQSGRIRLSPSSRECYVER